MTKIELDEYETSIAADLFRNYAEGLKKGEITVGGQEANTEEIEIAEGVLRKLEA